MVLLTTIVVAVVAHVLIPELPWAVAFVLGAIVSPTDAVAATAIAQRLGLPRRIVTILEGESLANDATGLVAYRLAVRLAWVFPGTYLPRWLIPGLAARDPSPSPRVVVIIGWAGMRGVVSLAAALALPLYAAGGQPFPGRDL